jgi:cytochrome oxidase Cu insertion factor (SCO1/SenC/PrrC family)
MNPMKKGFQLIMISAVLFAGISCSRSRTEISGQLIGGSVQILTLERLDVNRTTLIDSIETDKAGSFGFRIKQEEPGLFILKNEQGDLINLLLFPGDMANVRTSSDAFGSGYEVDGSEESEKIRQLVEHLTNTRNDLDSLLSMVDSLENPDDPQMELIEQAYAQTIIKQKRYTIRFIVENMSSLSSIYALYQKYDNQTPILGTSSDLQYFKSVADSLQVTHPENSLTRSLQADIKLKEQEIENAMQVEELLGMADEEITGLLDLSIPDRNGSEITLSSLQGKVILVFFWASDNQASVEALLQLRNTYNRYHNRGFEVYAISLDNDKVQWMQSIDYNEFDWINVSELTYPDSKAQIFYNVTSLPTTFLINREGDIVARNLYGRTLETWLDNLI